MLRSFSIAGFRNFGDQRRIVGPLDRVNIFIGTNNSGKSNVLRYVKRVVAPVLAPNHRTAIQLQGIDRPAKGQPVASVVIGLDFERDKKHGSWNTEWFELLSEAKILNESKSVITFDVSLAGDDQQNIYRGPVPEFEQQRRWQEIGGMEMSVAGVQHGNRDQSFKNLMGRLFSQYQHNLDVHYIPSFRQITTRLDEFVEEYAKATAEEHLIDGLAGLSAPRYDQQHKKEEFEKLRSFVGEVIDDANVVIEIPADRSTINVKSGDAFLPIESLGSGIHEVVMLAAEIILKKNSVILLEEPEVHLHPTLQRRLMRFIMMETDSQFFITTHSSTIIDTEGARIFGVMSNDGVDVKPLLTSQDKFNACHELGFRSSDLLQSNCVLWVEGPSDRIYINYLLSKVNSDLVEGIDYTYVFYGGKVLSHFSAEDARLDDLVSVLSVCRFAAFVMDSDLGSATAVIRKNKQRVIDELSVVGGWSWVTFGREIENYFLYADRERAILKVHPGAQEVSGSRNRFGKPLEYKVGGETRTADKIKIARYLVEQECEPQFDWHDKATSLAAYIARASERFQTVIAANT